MFTLHVLALAVFVVLCQAGPSTVTGRVENASGGYSVAILSNNGQPLTSWVPVTTTGSFSLTFKNSNRNNGQFLYAVARKNGGQQLLVSVLHRSLTSSPVVLNYHTTVASAYALAQFAKEDPTVSVCITGANVAIKNAGMISFLLADSRSGSLSTIIQNSDNGNSTTTFVKFKALVELVQSCDLDYSGFACVHLRKSTGRQSAFFAMVRLASSPLISIVTVSNLLPIPADWTLPIVLTNTGSATNSFLGPGGIAFDDDGNLYITNNYQYGSGGQCNQGKEPCPSPYIVILNPDGSPKSGSPFFGISGSILGPGYGISINRANQDLWVSNFVDLSPQAFLGNGDTGAGFVTHFSRNLQFIRKYNRTDIAGCQGITSDNVGNVFFTSLTTSRVFRIDVSGKITSVNVSVLKNPFDLDIDSQGNVWVSDANALTSPSYLVKFSNNLDFILAEQLPPPSQAIIDILLPGTGAKGVVVDSHDNVWVSNWLADSVSAFTNDGIELQGSPFSVKGPWGLSIDGNDNIYVAGFGTPVTLLDGHSVTVLCGASSHDCTLGDVISAPNGWGYDSNSLQRVTDVEIGSNGAVWACNNWKRQPTPTSDPGGNGMVVFPGLGIPPKKRTLG